MRTDALQPPLVGAQAFEGHLCDGLRIAILSELVFGALDKRAGIGQWSRAPRATRSRTSREEFFLLDLFLRGIVECCRGINLGQRAVGGSEIRILGQNFIEALDGGGSVATYHAANEQVTVHQLAGMFESERLVFLRQLPQVALNAVLLDGILIALVNENIS